MKHAAWSTLLVVGLLSPSAMAQTAAPPSLIDEIGIDQRLNVPIPSDLAFQDADGRALRFRDLLAGRPLLLVPVYYECPMLCGETLRGLVGALKAVPLEVGKDFDVVVASFDPSETPVNAAKKREEILGEYGKERPASGWHFLTGSEATTRSLTEAMGFRYAYDPKTGQFAHASVILVLTPDGTISRYFFGIDYPPRNLRLALVEASRGKIGSVVDQLILYCYHYDPETGRYGVVIMNVLRLAGVATVFLIGGFMFWSIRRERHRGPHVAAPAPPNNGERVV
jgi:protein SCO1/2